MITIQIGDAARVSRAAANRMEKLRTSDLKIRKQANRNVGRKLLTKMVRKVSSDSGIKQAAIRGQKIGGKSNQWSRVGLFSRPPSSPKSDARIRFNMSPIPFRKIGKLRDVDSGGVITGGGYYEQNAFIGQVKGGRRYRPKYDKPASGSDSFAFERQTRSRYPLRQSSVEIETHVQRAASQARARGKVDVVKEVIRLKQKARNR